MAHYAKLGINSKVIAVHVVADKDCQNADGIEDEEVGRQFLENIHNWPLWKKTSYNTQGNKHNSGDDSKAFRGNYAGIGYTYDADNDVVMGPKPYSKWVLDESTWSWKAPTDMPDDDKSYTWNDNKGEWEEVTE